MREKQTEIRRKPGGANGERMSVRIHEYERLLIAAALLPGGKTYKHRKKGKVNKNLMKGGWRCYETTNERTGA